MRLQRTQSGFTLIELSIVLVIIGLIVGGVLVGRDLIKAAELRSIARDIEKFRTAITAFESKYDCRPGDCTTATRFWGVDAGCPQSDPTDQSPRIVTCNGNGDGFIGHYVQLGYTWPDSYEWFRSWQHLSNAGLIDGQYSGRSGVGTYNLYTYNIPGKNAPNSKIGETVGYAMMDISNAYTYYPSSSYQREYGHVIILGANDGNMSGAPALTPTDALSIDNKLDDGNPVYGSLHTGKSICTTTNAEATARYNTSISNIACTLLFELGF